MPSKWKILRAWNSSATRSNYANPHWLQVHRRLQEQHEQQLPKPKSALHAMPAWSWLHSFRLPTMLRLGQLRQGPGMVVPDNANWVVIHGRRILSSSWRILRNLNTRRSDCNTWRILLQFFDQNTVLATHEIFVIISFSYAVKTVINCQIRKPRPTTVSIPANVLYLLLVRTRLFLSFWSYAVFASPAAGAISLPVKMSLTRIRIFCGR